ncbi:MAG TPA: serine/threonine-protein kinase [Nannocystaceae bacterium]|nr:serine/threonine-protein kinase [Nannocystaceae bacterium]
MTAHPSIGACPSAEQLACLVDGTLDADVLDTLQRHLGECDVCCALLASLARVDSPAEDTDVIALRAGAQLGRYVLRARLGQGGMGVVWRARDPELDRDVAIKVLAGATLDADAEARLLREAQSMARLSHANVVGVNDVGVIDGRVFLAMELIEGETLRQWLARGPHPRHEVLARFVAAGRGLAEAHAHGIVHRDFKPDNVLVGHDGRVCVTDFGLARVQARTEISTELDAGDPDPTRLTRTGAFVGTPAYMAPEQFHGQPSDARSDQFAFCVALWEALFGARPFAGKSLGELAHAVISGELRERPRDVRIPAALEHALRRGLAREPAQRWPDVNALLAAIATDRSGPRRVLAAAGFVLAGTLAASWYVGRDSDAQAIVCTGASARLAGVWDDERRTAVAQAIRATGVVYAETTIDGVSTRLDRYTDDWIAMHTDACEATARGDQPAATLDLRMACLARRRDEIAALVQVLASADAATVEHAIAAALGLTPVAACADIERLSIDQPADPQLAAEVHVQRAALLLAFARGVAGDLREGKRLSEPVVAKAEALGFAPFIAEALVTRGDLAFELGEYAQADTDLQRAWDLAVATRADHTAARAATTLISVELKQLAYDDALAWGNQAIAMSVRAGKDDELEAEARIGLGVTRLHRGELELAQPELERALEIRRRVHAPDDVRIAASLRSLGDLAVTRMELDVALGHYQQSVALFEAALGWEHPSLVAPVMNMGGVYFRKGQLAPAEVLFRRALTVHEHSHPAAHPDLVIILTNLGNIEHAQEHWEAALQHYARAQQVALELFGPDHAQVGIALVNVANTKLGMKDFEGARADFQRTLELWEGDLVDNPSLAYPLVGLGSALVQLGRFAEAVPHLERALVIRTKFATGEIEMVEVESALAKALWELGSDRPRADFMSCTARERTVALGSAQAERVSELDTWLAAHAP